MGVLPIYSLFIRISANAGLESILTSLDVHPQTMQKIIAANINRIVLFIWHNLQLKK